eukprot:3059516-Rhodomonas_salina.2
MSLETTRPWVGGLGSARDAERRASLSIPSDRDLFCPHAAAVLGSSTDQDRRAVQVRGPCCTEVTCDSRPRRRVLQTRDSVGARRDHDWGSGHGRLEERILFRHHLRDFARVLGGEQVHVEGPGVGGGWICSPTHQVAKWRQTPGIVSVCVLLHRARDMVNPQPTSDNMSSLRPSRPRSIDANQNPGSLKWEDREQACGDERAAHCRKRRR